MNKYLCLIIFLVAQASYGQVQYGVDIASSTPTTSSPGFVFGWPQYASQNFNYNGQYLNLYGLGFHGYNDGTSIGGINAYVSSYFGVDFFTAGLRRFRINTDGTTFFDQNMWVDRGATISSDFADNDPNYSWNYNLMVRNNNNANNTFSRLSFVSQSGGFGAISVMKTDTYTGDMHFQVRNGAGFFQTPLIIKSSGYVGIGTSIPDAKLAVKGQVHAQEVKVDLNGAVAPDYVFEKEYKLASLEEIKNYIAQNKHLPEVPSAKEMEKNGVQLGEMNMLLLKKIEELTLYVIELRKEIDTLKSK